MSDCAALDTKLTTILADLQAFKSSKDDDFLQLVEQHKDAIVSILMTASTWDEIPIQIDLAEHIKVS